MGMRHYHMRAMPEATDCSKQWNASKERSVDRSAFGRALHLLDVLADCETPLTFSELARRANLPKATAHRLVRRLEHHGLVARRDRYIALGLRLFELGNLAESRRFGLRETAVPFMEDVFEATHEIVNLGVLDRNAVVYLEKLSGHRRARLSTQTGVRIPANCTGLGKAILAFSPDS